MFWKQATPLDDEKELMIADKENVEKIGASEHEEDGL